jgi:DNA (cytosine-5)-methyltransferase 1
VNLVLSLFPGIGLLDRAFEEEGFCVVRGPDLLWGGDVRRFNPPAGRFDGVIGGPPCQLFSRFRFLNPRAGKHGNLIPEFERIANEAQPLWFLMENVPDAPEPVVDGYSVASLIINNRWCEDGETGAEQERVRRFCFGSVAGLKLNPVFAAIDAPLSTQAITSSGARVPVKIGGSGKLKASLKPPTVTASDTPGPGRRGKGNYMTWQEKARLQGLPDDFDIPPFKVEAKHAAIGNGVPLPMGRAVARAVKQAIANQREAA